MTPTVSQQKTERERIQPFVLQDTAARLRLWSVVRNMSQGELIDQMVQELLPPMPKEKYEAAS
jgi:hypothetical protein